MKRLNSPRPLFFARKFEEFVSQEAVNTLDFRLYGKYPTGSPSINSYWENIWNIQDFRKTDNSKVNMIEFFDFTDQSNSFNKMKNRGFHDLETRNFRIFLTQNFSQIVKWFE